MIKKGEYMKDEINELETNCLNKSIISIMTGINKFEKC
jgi:hypothetical protein